MRRDLVRRVEALEQGGNYDIATWLDLVKAADAPPGTPLKPSPAMQDLFDTTLRE